MECAVCMNYCDGDIYSTYCGHLFCKECANKMTKSSSGSCWTCKSPIQANSVHKIYLPAPIVRQPSIDLTQDSQEITKEEMMKTLMSDLEIECEKNVQKCMELKEAVDHYAIHFANFVCLNEDLKRKNRELEQRLATIQTRLDRCEQIVDDFDNHGYNTRYKRRAVRSD